MIGLHQIVLGGGEQTLVHTPSVRPDASPAPTVLVEDLTEDPDAEDRELVAVGEATRDDFDEALTATSGLGTTNPRRMHVDGTSLVVGRRYVLEAEGGDSQIVTIAASTATWADATGPLGAAFSTEARLRGLELRVTIPAEVAALEDLLEEEHALRVRWVYAIHGRTITVDEQARLVRQHGHEAYLGEAEAILRDEYDELVALLPRRAGALGSLVRGCARSMSVKLRARNIDPGAFLAGPAGLEALVACCVWQFGMRGLVPRGGADPTTWTDWARAQYLNLWGALVKGSPGRDVVEPDLATDQAPRGHSKRRRTLIVPK